MKPYYDHAGITIFNCDCREVLSTLPKCDLVLTDPPYGISWRRGVNHAAHSHAHLGILNDHDTTARDAALEVFPDTPSIVFGSFYAPFPKRLKQVLVWQKSADSGLVGCVTGYRRDAEPIFLVGPWPVRNVERSCVLRGYRSQSACAADANHPHAKPVPLIRDLLLFSPPGMIIDPFMGSGTTLVAAKQLGRRCVGIELVESYCEIAAKRLQQEILPFLDVPDSVPAEEPIPLFDLEVVR